MLYDLELVGFHADVENGPLPLRFDFKTDAVPQGDGRWQRLGNGQKVFTGHASGVITINVREADSVEREINRVALGEPQRTLIGHFRHEVGHYVWDVLIKDQPQQLKAFTDVFGDPYQPAYGDALKRHYAQGPPADWPERFISPYASMHPWEDFAETWQAYLDIFGTLELLASYGWLHQQTAIADLPARIDAYVRTGVSLNELNRNAGLLPLIPEMFSKPVREKLAQIHACLGSGSA